MIQDVDGLYTCLSKALTLLGSANTQYKVQRRKQVLDKLNPQMSSLASEAFPDAGKNLFGPSFEEKVKKRNETVKVLSKAAPRKSNMQFFWRGTSSQFRPRRGGQFPGRWSNYQPGFPTRGRSSYFIQRPGPEQGKTPGGSNKSDLCSTPKFRVAVASQSNTGILPVKENLTFPKAKLFLSSLGLSSVAVDHLPIAGRLQFFVEN